MSSAKGEVDLEKIKVPNEACQRATPLMLRAVGAGAGRRCTLRDPLVALRQDQGSRICQVLRLPRASLSTSISQCTSRCSSTSSTSQSLHIDVPQTDYRSLASLPSGSSVTVAGWLTSRRRMGKSLSFAVLLLPRGQGRLQLIAKGEENSDEENRNVAVWDEAGNQGVVLVEGQLQRKPSKDVRQEQETVSRSNMVSEHSLTLPSCCSRIRSLISNCTSATQRYSIVC